MWLRKLGIRFMTGGERIGETFVLVEHLVGPRALAAPMHAHHYEYTHVLEGEVGVEVGEEVLVALRWPQKVIERWRVVASAPVLRLPSGVGWSCHATRGRRV